MEIQFARASLSLSPVARQSENWKILSCEMEQHLRLIGSCLTRDSEAN